MQEKVLVEDEQMESSLPAPVKEFRSDTLIYESVGMYISLPKGDFTFLLAEATGIGVMSLCFR